MSTVLPASLFLQSLKQQVLEHPFLQHSFLQCWQAQPISLVQGQIFARLYYPHIARTRLYQACALGITPHEPVQAVLANILYDEYGNGALERSHLAMYRRFMRALGVEEASANVLIPELQAYIDTMLRMVQGEDWLVALGAAGVAGEWPIPDYYRQLLNGLRTLPAVHDEDLLLFIEHIDLDVEHASQLDVVLLPYLDTPIAQQSLARGVQMNLNARVLVLNGLQREVFG